MPSYARRLVVPEGEDCVVHAISRCVRRAWLCGRDPYSGKDYEHRREWVRDRVRHLAGIFAIEVCAYAIMSNHSHFVLWCRPSVAAGWSGEEVARRWAGAFGPRGRALTGAEIKELAKDEKQIAEWRARLGSVSWFMRCLNEHIARLANKEDDCKGRFWEGRFKSQLLADDGAVLACMAYVDLNPVRAKLAVSLEDCEFTSVFDRITGRQGRAKLAAFEKQAGQPVEAGARGGLDSRGKALGAGVDMTHEAMKAREDALADAWLCPLRADVHKHTVLDISLDGYLALVEWTGQALRADKRGALPKGMRPMLEELELDVEKWVATVRSFGRIYHIVAGKEQKLRENARANGRRWVAGVKTGRGVYQSTTVG